MIIEIHENEFKIFHRQTACMRDDLDKGFTKSILTTKAKPVDYRP